MGRVRWSVEKNWIEQMGMEEGSRRVEWGNSTEFNGENRTRHRVAFD